VSAQGLRQQSHPILVALASTHHALPEEKWTSFTRSEAHSKSRRHRLPRWSLGMHDATDELQRTMQHLAVQE